MRKMIPAFKGVNKLRAGDSLRVNHVAADAKSLEWDKLGFQYLPTKTIVAYDWNKGSWSQGRLQPPVFELHAMSNAMHYGQAVFEGLKAFHTVNDDIHVVNANENVKRLENSAKRLGLPIVPKEMFNEAIDAVIKANKEYIPPYGTNGSLYLRPFLFGHGPRLGLGPADQYIFGIQVCPVGSYYKSGLNAVNAVILEGYDRAAPQGVGNVKCAGNYGADVVPSRDAAARGFPVVLYLDPKQGLNVEEFSTSNFVGITKDGSTFVTPKSESILDSVTKKMLMQIAADIGLKVESRTIPFSEAITYKEVAACGTAVVITPVKSITDERMVSRKSDGSIPVYHFQGFAQLKTLYDKIRAIQVGTEKDKHGWCRVVCKASD